MDNISANYMRIHLQGVGYYIKRKKTNKQKETLKTMVATSRFELSRAPIKGTTITLWVLLKGKKIFKCAETVGRLTNTF